MCSDNNFAVINVLETSDDTFETFHVVLGGLVKILDNRAFDILLLGEFSLLYNICASHKFGSKLYALSFGNLHLVFCPLN